MRIAVLSDTHGNLTAFEAVLADIDQRAVDHIYHLGDVAGKGPRGSACCDLARVRCEQTVQGNWDVALLAAADAAPSSGSRWWRDELSSENLEWLATRPFQIDFELAGIPVRCFHASADDVFHRVYPNVEGKEWDELFLNNETTGDASLEPKLVIYGDIHYACSRKVGDRTLLNCGAVGNPLDEPTASYVVLDDTTGTVQWELIRIPYDIESEIAVAREVNMPQYQSWEHELRTAEYAR